MPAAPFPVSVEFPVEVRDFADRNGLGDYIQPILEITRTVFGDAVRGVSLATDPENASDVQMEFGVDVTGWSPDEMLAARKAWTQRLISSSLPALVRCYFRILMEQHP